MQILTKVFTLIKFANTLTSSVPSYVPVFICSLILYYICNSIFRQRNYWNDLSYFSPHTIHYLELIETHQQPTTQQMEITKLKYTVCEYMYRSIYIYISKHHTWVPLLARKCLFNISSTVGILSLYPSILRFWRF